jgi:hypothetical protein
MDKFDFIVGHYDRKNTAKQQGNVACLAGIHRDGGT